MAKQKKKGTYKNLSYIVHMVQNDLGDTTTTTFERLLQMAFQGFRQLNLYDVANIKVAYLQMNDNFTIDLPDDYVDYTKIGICNGGQVVTLGQNKELCLPRKANDCGEPLSVGEHSTIDDEEIDISADFGAGFGFGYGYYFASHFRNGQYVGELFGIGGGFNTSYYRIDEENWQIAFSSRTPEAEVVLEYKSDGSATDGSAVVPPEAIEPLTMYVHWRMTEFSKNASETKKARLRTLFEEEVTKLRAFQLSFTLDEYYDSYYATIKSGPKR